MCRIIRNNMRYPSVFFVNHSMMIILMLTLNDTAAFLSGTSINIHWPSWSSVWSLDIFLLSLTRLYLIPLFYSIFCPASWSSVLRWFRSFFLFCLLSQLHQPSLTAAADVINDDVNSAVNDAVDDDVDGAIDGKQRGLFWSSFFDDDDNDDDDNNSLCRRCHPASGYSLFQSLEGVSIDTKGDTVDDGLVCCFFLRRVSQFSCFQLFNDAIGDDCNDDNVDTSLATASCFLTIAATWTRCCSCTVANRIISFCQRVISSSISS